MTYEAFLAAVKKKGPWAFRQGEIVQERSAVTCPWLAAGARNDEFTSVKHKRSITRTDIFLAADNSPKHEVFIRRDLLKACGLEEKKR